MLELLRGLAPGRSLRALAGELEVRGVLARNGRPFAARTLSRLVTDRSVTTADLFKARERVSSADAGADAMAAPVGPPPGPRRSGDINGPYTTVFWTLDIAHCVQRDNATPRRDGFLYTSEKVSRPTARLVRKPARSAKAPGAQGARLALWTRDGPAASMCWRSRSGRPPGAETSVWVSDRNRGGRVSLTVREEGLYSRRTVPDRAPATALEVSA